MPKRIGPSLTGKLQRLSSHAVCLLHVSLAEAMTVHSESNSSKCHHESQRVYCQRPIHPLRIKGASREEHKWDEECAGHIL